MAKVQRYRRRRGTGQTGTAARMKWSYWVAGLARVIEPWAWKKHFPEYRRRKVKTNIRRRRR